MNLAKRTITISEVFGPTLQGEGALIGRPTLFVRTGGCDFRCEWCDSMHAVDEKKHGSEWEELSPEAVMEQLLDRSGGFPMLVTLSGGNPAMQPLGELIAIGRNHGYTFALETQGTIARDWFAKLDYLVISPKGPSSGMPFREQKLIDCLWAARPQSGSEKQPEISLKVVVFDDADYEFARGLAEKCPALPMYLQAGTSLQTQGRLVHGADILSRMCWLAEKVGEDRWTNVRVLPQVHVLMWGDKRGV